MEVQENYVKKIKVEVEKENPINKSKNNKTIYYFDYCKNYYLFFQ
jgi:hypothetical protein